MSGDDTSGDDTQGFGSPGGFWDRTLPGWHVSFAVLLAVAAGFIVVDAGLTAGERLLGVALCAALGVWYLLVGRRALGYGRPSLSLLYVAGATVLFFPLTWLSTDTFVLLFILYPQIFACLEDLRLALGAVVALSVVTITARVLGTGGGGWGSIVAGLLTMVFAALLGLWMAGVIRESDKRAELLAELERTRGELAAANRREGVLAERQRLAHEIHDTLAQGFTSLLMLIRAAKAAVPSQPEAARERLTVAERTAEENLSEARSLVAALAPADLRQPDGLVGAVQRLLVRFEEETGIAADFDPAVDRRDAPALPATVEIVLLRTVQEALHNVRKHAEADRVRVRLETVDPQHVLLEVADDGRGFDPPAANGFGLAGMVRRAEQLGGVVTVASAAGEGTTVRAVIPHG